MKKSGLIIGLVLAFCLAFAAAAPAADQQPERGGYKKVTVACLRASGEPISPCDIDFTSNHPLGGPRRCITAETGICQQLLYCCNWENKPPQILWRLKATSIHGEKTTSFWISCGTCSESKLVRFIFE